MFSRAISPKRQREPQRPHREIINPPFPVSLIPGRIPPRCQPVRKETLMRPRLLLVWLSIAVCVVPALAQKRNITEKDLFNFVWAGDTQISPDGSRVAFVRVTVNEKKDG